MKNQPYYLIVYYPSMIALVLIVTLSNAYAVPGTSSVGNTLCLAAGWMHGNVGKAIAILGVFIIGVSALFNQIKWSTVAIVAVGVAILFSAEAIIGKLGYHTCTYYGVSNGIVVR